MCKCQEAKQRTTSPGLEIESQLQAQAGRLGREVVLKRIRAAAKQALAQIPEEGPVRLDEASRRFFARVSTLVESALRAPEWGDEELARFAGELSWAHLAVSLVTVVSNVKGGGGGGGGGGGVTCVTGCENEYQQCVSENSCDTSGWFCLCCAPCSLQYMGCVAKCSIPGGGFSGIGIGIA